MVKTTNQIYHDYIYHLIISTIYRDYIPTYGCNHDPWRTVSHNQRVKSVSTGWFSHGLESDSAEFFLWTSEHFFIPFSRGSSQVFPISIYGRVSKDYPPIFFEGGYVNGGFFSLGTLLNRTIFNGGLSMSSHVWLPEGNSLLVSHFCIAGLRAFTMCYDFGSLDLGKNQINLYKYKH